VPKHMLEVVIDADVARSSGETEHPVSSSCRKVLSAMLDKEHCFVACPQLLSEWKRHGSGFATRWLASMVARKRVAFITTNRDFAKAVAAIAMDDATKQSAQKDAHLIDAARAKGLFVTSRDDNARTSIRKLVALNHLWRDIAWVNPVSESSTLEKYFSDPRSKAPTL
jgi:hypothetical protein